MDSNPTRRKVLVGTPENFPIPANDISPLLI
jgi:hypothetical protein